jgi:hypothetical protein
MQRDVALERPNPERGWHFWSRNWDGGEEERESTPKVVWQSDLTPPGVTTTITLGSDPCVFWESEAERVEAVGVKKVWCKKYVSSLGVDVER